MNYFGLLVDETQLADLALRDKFSLFGIGTSEEGVPIETLGIHLLGAVFPRYSLLILDEFGKMNGISGDAFRRLEFILDLFDSAYKKVPRIKTSDFMKHQDYLSLFTEVKDRITDNPELLKLIKETIPERLRRRKNSLDYPIHECACVGHLHDYRRGYDLKIGQKREQLYDRVIAKLFPHISFAYLQSVYALNTPNLIEVTPYLANKTGIDPGKNRILLNGNADTVKSAVKKLQNSHPTALKFYARLGSLAGYVMDGNLARSKEGIDSMSYVELRDFTVNVMKRNVLEPVIGKFNCKK